MFCFTMLQLNTCTQVPSTESPSGSCYQTTVGWLLFLNVVMSVSTWRLDSKVWQLWILGLAEQSRQNLRAQVFGRCG